MALVFLLYCFSAAALAGPSPGRSPAVHVLSEEPRIELRPKFLREEEMAAIQKLAEEEMFKDLSDPETGSSASTEVAGGEEISTLNISDPDVDTEDALEWDVLQDVIHRSKVLSPEPLTAFGAHVVRWEPWHGLSRLNRSGPLHLDARLHPERRHSVLLFLSGTGKAKDGATVFPCIETEDMEPREVKRRQKLCSRALRHLQQAHEKLMALRAEGMELPPSKQYQFLEDHPELSGLPRERPDGTRPVNYLWLPSHDAVAADEALAPLSHLRAEPLHALAEAMCRGKALGLKVASKRGDALFMDVMDTEGREVKADWRLWHAGCSPLEPDQRLTAQIFLETDTNSSNLACCDSKGGTCAESCRSQKMTS